METTRELLLVHHSRTGGSAQMARAAAEAARAAEPTLRVRDLTAADASPQDLLQADGYVFAAPENLATLSGQMKEFFDRCYYPVLGRLGGRPYVALICAGSDGEGAARQLARICTGWRLKAVAEPVIVRTAAQTPEAIMSPKVIGQADLARCAEIGAMLAGGLAMGVF